MKFSQVAFVAASALLSGTASADAGSAAKRQKILAHYANGTKVIAGRDQVVDRAGGVRYKKVTVDGSGSVYVLEEHAGKHGEQRRRHLQINRMSGGVLPWPANGATIERTPKALQFREDTSISDVKCFHFTHTVPALSFSVCDGPKITYADGIAELQAGGFAAGEWTWNVQSAAGDDSIPQTFTIVEPEGGDISHSISEIVSEAEWGNGGKIQGTVGRIYFSSWNEDTIPMDYACSGTVVKDETSGRSIILTAAHCVFDDVNWQFGENVIFIPNRHDVDYEALGMVTGADVHRECSADVCGCWFVSAGVVPEQWSAHEWPACLEYDYGFYIVDDQDAHTGTECGSDGESLEGAVGAMDMETRPPSTDYSGTFVHGMGYSLEYNPDFRYCSNNIDITQIEQDSPESTYWIDDCRLSSGASGGPFIKDMGADGTGKVISVNSWEDYDFYGQGGPIIDETILACLMDEATSTDFLALENKALGDQGTHLNCDGYVITPPETGGEHYPETGGETPGPLTASSSGDPHMKVWSGEKFDFHGACDLLLFKNPEYANGAGISIHIRTKIDTFWSFIEAAVIRIGDDTLEIMGRKEDAGQHWVNGKLGEEPKEDGLLGFKLGGHDVHLKKTNSVSNRFRIELGNGDAISMDTYKKFVSVNIRAKTPEKFNSASGLMGSYPAGEWMGRDGKTLFKDPIEFGKEWQVLSSEPMLFHNIEGVQHPRVCAMPEEDSILKEKKKRRLGASMITGEDAARACARVRPEARDECIFDVLATNDKDMAGAY